MFEIHHLLCFRCHEPGHSSSKCFKKLNRCVFCTSLQHSYKSCSEIICNNCYNPGHVSKNCKNSKKCIQCFAGGHSIDNCVSRPEPCRNHEVKGLTCIKCKKTGHLNCGFVAEDEFFSKLSCFICGLKGHSAEICTMVNKEGKIELFRRHVKEAMKEIPETSKNMNFKERRYWDKVEKKAFKNLLKKTKNKNKKRSQKKK